MNKSKENDFKEYESLLSDGDKGEARDKTCMRKQIHRPGLFFHPHNRDQSADVESWKPAKLLQAGFWKTQPVELVKGRAC